MTISDELIGLFEQAAEMFSQPGELIGLDVVWEIQRAKTPEGQLVVTPMPTLILVAKHVILGAAPPISMVLPLPFWASLDQPSVNKVITDIVGNLRTVKAEALRVSNGHQDGQP